MSEIYNYIPHGCSIALPEPPPVYISVPIFDPAAPVVDPIVDDAPDLVETILLGIAEIIRRELQALRTQEEAQNSTTLPIESAMAMLGCKRSKVFILLKQGLLKRAPKVGRSVMVTVASIEALIADGLPRKGRMRSCGSERQPTPVSMKARVRRREKNTSGAKQDPGDSIRNLAI